MHKREINYKHGICPLAENKHEKSTILFEMCLHQLEKNEIELIDKCFERFGKIWESYKMKPDIYDSQVIFLTGHRKAGTSLLSRLLEGHEDVVSYPTDLTLLYAFFPLLEEGLIDPSDNVGRFRNVINESIQLGMKGYSTDNEIAETQSSLLNALAPLISNGDFCDRSCVLAAIAQWLKAQNATASQILFKETSQLQNYTALKAIFPESKFVNIIRDPRDNMAAVYEGVSKSYASFGDDARNALFSVANKAMFDLNFARKFDEANRSDVITVRFEDIVSDTKKTMKLICDFLNLDFSDQVLRPTQNGFPYAGNNHSGKKFTGIYDGNKARWKERLPNEYSAFVEFFCYDAMVYWGYEPEFELDEVLSLTSKFLQNYNYRYFFRDRYGATS